MSNVGESPWSWFLRDYTSFERERKIRFRLFTSSIQREIRHFQAVVVQWRQRNLQKSVLHVQSCCFANQSYFFCGVLAAVAVIVAKAPTNLYEAGNILRSIY